MGSSSEGPPIRGKLLHLAGRLSALPGTGALIASVMRRDAGLDRVREVPIGPRDLPPGTFAPIGPEEVSP